LESSFLELLVGHPELLAEAAAVVDQEWFRDPACRVLAARLLGPPVAEPTSVLSDPDLDPRVRGLLSALLSAARVSSAPDRALVEGVGAMRRRALEEEQRALGRELSELGPDEAAGELRRALLQRMQETAQALAGLTPWAARKERE
ncbi:MAG TPA: hypothetical protein VFP52_03545, partial [Myxococcales bacterium]|nr:hypothetical protein [Myxococcales bacterium]